MDADKWDVFLEQYQTVVAERDMLREAVDYAIGKFGKQDMEGYLEEIYDILGEDRHGEG